MPQCILCSAPVEVGTLLTKMANSRRGQATFMTAFIAVEGCRCVSTLRAQVAVQRKHAAMQAEVARFKAYIS